MLDDHIRKRIGCSRLELIEPDWLCRIAVSGGDVAAAVCPPACRSVLISLPSRVELKIILNGFVTLGALAQSRVLRVAPTTRFVVAMIQLVRASVASSNPTAPLGSHGKTSGGAASDAAADHRGGTRCNRTMSAC